MNNITEKEKKTFRCFLDSIKSKLTFANVVATLTLVVAILVGHKQIQLVIEQHLSSQVTHQIHKLNISAQRMYQKYEEYSEVAKDKTFSDPIISNAVWSIINSSKECISKYPELENQLSVILSSNVQSAAKELAVHIGPALIDLMSAYNNILSSTLSIQKTQNPKANVNVYLSPYKASLLQCQRLGKTSVKRLCQGQVKIKKMIEESKALSAEEQSQLYHKIVRKTLRIIKRVLRYQNKQVKSFHVISFVALDFCLMYWVE